MQATLELRALDRSHMDQARRWRNDWRVWAWTRQNDLISDWDQEKWFERQAADPTIKMYAVVSVANGTDRLVGVAGLTSLDWPNRRAEFSLYVGPEHQRAGFGRRALETLLAHAFGNLGLRQVWGETFDGNPAMKLFGELGFQVDGKRRGFYFKDGKFIDAYLISIMDDEWRALRGKPGPTADAPERPDAVRGDAADPPDEDRATATPAELAALDAELVALKKARLGLAPGRGFPWVGDAAGDTVTVEAESRSDD